MKDKQETSIRVGIGFGIPSGVVTTLGLIVGLYVSTLSKPVVLSGVLTIALADALSDGFGMHLSEESRGEQSKKRVWILAFTAFLAKLFTAISFAIPFLLLGIDTAFYVDIAWGVLLLTTLSYELAKDQRHTVGRIIAEHIVLATLVVVASWFIGKLAMTLFQ